MSKKKGRVLVFYGSDVHGCLIYLVLLRYAKKSNPKARKATQQAEEFG